MSTKTNFKRVALVAVAALGLGVLTSVAPANAAASTTSTAYTSGTTGGLSTNHLDGNTFCSVNAEDGSSLTVATGTAKTTTADDTTNVTSVTLPVGATFGFLTSDATDFVDASDTAIIRLEDSTASTVTLSGKRFTSAADADAFVVRAIAIGEASISTYTTGTTTAKSTISITVVANCSNDTFSAADSKWEINTATDSTPTSTTSVFTYENLDIAYVSIVGNNAYGAAVGAGTWIGSVTGGCVIDLATSSPAATALTSDALLLTAGTNIYAAVKAATTVKYSAVTCPVTISYNGVTVFSKTINITGDVATLTVSGADVQKSADNSLTGLYDVVAKDAAGNQLAWAFAGDSAKYDTVVTSVTGGTSSATSSTVSAATWTCTVGKSGKTVVRVKATTNAGATIYSNEFDAKCGGDAYTYTASLDKASYVPGDLATLTIVAKDRAGEAPYKTETVGATAAPEIAGSQMSAIATPTSADTFDATGTKKYTFTVLSTAGKYNMSVNLGYTGNSPVSVAYTVGSDGTVSNADILKAIVSLIASINKQIAALQKALLKK